MSKKIYLHIPEPCHENWENMSPVQQGRFCTSCSKQVVDFSSMTDKEILHILEKSAGTTCGRLTKGQLQRPIVKEIPSLLQPRKLLVSTLTPAILLTINASCQTNKNGEVVQTATEVVMLMGDTIATPNLTKTIKGNVTFANGSPAANVQVSLKDSEVNVRTDSEGSFKLNISDSRRKVKLLFNYIGFKEYEVEVTKGAEQDVNVTLLDDNVVLAGLTIATIVDDDNLCVKPSPVNRAVIIKGRVTDSDGNPLPNAALNIKGLKAAINCDSAGNFFHSGVVTTKKDHIIASAEGYKKRKAVIDYSNYDSINIKLSLIEVEAESNEKDAVDSSTTIVAGGVRTVATVSVIDTAKSFFDKVFRDEMFSIYPNPLPAGNDINIAFKKSGSYSIHVFDNSGKLYLYKDVVVSGKNEVFKIRATTSMTTGVYFIKAIEINTRKQFINKIVVQ